MEYEKYISGASWAAWEMEIKQSTIWNLLLLHFWGGLKLIERKQNKLYAIASYLQRIRAPESK